MIPHIEIPSLGPLKPFGILVATGIIVGNWFALRRARQAKIDLNEVRSAVAWAVVIGFIGAHLFALVYYKPERVADEGVISLVKIWDGISSFGGFIGALMGLLIYFGKGSRPPAAQAAILAVPWVAGAMVGVHVLTGQILFGLSLLAIAIYYWKPDRPWSGVAEIIVQALVVGWIFGRAGCTVAFDHPGSISDFFLAEEYVPGIARHNLGFYEMLFTLFVLLPVQLLLWRRNPPKGLIMGVISALYAIGRFGFDYLRATDLTTADVRFLGLTPAQYACLGLLAFGLWLIVHVRRRAADPAYPHVMDLRPDYAGLTAVADPKTDGPGEPRPRKRAVSRR